MILSNLPFSVRARIACLTIPLTFLWAATAPGDDRFSPVGRLLIRRCLECHNAQQAAGGLVLETEASLLEGGESGAAVAPGDPGGSRLWERVSAGEMPPAEKGRSQKLPAAELNTLRQWIADGAKWPARRRLDPYELTTDKRGGRDWWSLQPVARPAAPAVANSSWTANPIDAFVLARLESESLAPAGEATRAELIRRLYFDVVGLPPTFEEIAAFVGDDDPAAYSRLVDRLLASPHYGERWGRHWLDLARYAETCGYERDQVKPSVWKYRDWVIQSLNDDKPYDRFVLEQLAGDELPERDEQSVIATGFLRLGAWNDEPNDPHEYKYERLEDMVHAASTAFLGMTVKCARCHDHKFDPIPQVDYYRMASAFWAGPIEPGDRQLLGGPTAEQLGFDVFGWTDRARDPPPLHLLVNGNPKQPGPPVPFAHLTLFPGLSAPLEAPPPTGHSTRRRLQLARWIARPDNPLTARVLVNRLWQHHFGQPLVRSPNNFGFKGELPTHPQLLDWLAAELVEPTQPAAEGAAAPRAWTLKRMHKLILMSSTYRQSANHSKFAECFARDSGNRLLWRGPRRRLDAESIRDRMLAASGEIDLRLGGASFLPTIHPEALEGLSRKASAWQASPASEQRRRSVYLFTKRGLLPPLLTVFDFSDTTLPCGQRDVTTVAPQALALLNNQFVHQRSQALAQRVVRSAGPRREGQIRAAWQFALGRIPSSTEEAAAAAHLAAQQASFASRRQRPDGPPADSEIPLRDGLALHLRGDAGVDADADGRVSLWRDQSGRDRHARQPQAESRPALALQAIGGRPSLRFDGRSRFLKLDGQVLTSQHCAVFAVATDLGGGSHREIFSNWNGAAGNATTSIFLGTTGEAAVRFSDAFAPAGAVDDRTTPFILTATSDERDAAVFQNATELARKGSPLPPRDLSTDYVVGQQGNIGGEYWKGDIAELIVFDRALSRDEVGMIWDWLRRRYQLSFATEERKSAELLALESLCHVLLNSNEFVYVD